VSMLSFAGLTLFFLLFVLVIALLSLAFNIVSFIDEFVVAISCVKSWLIKLV